MHGAQYVGIDVHPATIWVAVLASPGQFVMESILVPNAATLLQFFAGLRGTLAVTFEEGTWAACLYDLLKPHVAMRGAEHVPLVRQASRFYFRDACCLRDGAHAPRLAILVPEDPSSTVYHHDDYGVGLRHAGVGVRSSPRVRISRHLNL